MGTVERTRSPRCRRAVRALLAATALPAAALLPRAARAADQVYIGPSGNWSDAAQWSGGAPPASGDGAQLLQSAPVTVNFDPAAVANNLASLVTDGVGLTDGAFTLTQFGNDLATTTEYVGVDGFGV